jgi:tripeptide aminopeptidase
VSAYLYHGSLTGSLRKMRYFCAEVVAVEVTTDRMPAWRRGASAGWRYTRRMPCSVGSDVLDMFLALAETPSPPGRERAVADQVTVYLRELGLDVDEDDAGSRIGSEIGNLYCRLPATAPGTPIFLNAHLDTVPHETPIEPVVQEGVVRNGRVGILGADNKAAVAAMLAATGEIVTRGLPHAGLELVFTPMEEVGLRGAKAFARERLGARHGYCYDHAAPIGDIVLAAPSQNTITLTFKGRAAHSGIAPEEGRSAIIAAARAIVDMHLGRIDAETTANVGIVRGGSARNIVPEECVVLAEARSRDAGKVRALTQSMLDAAVYAANLADCQVDSHIGAEYEAYRFTRRDEPVALAARALGASGFEPRYIESGGGADANVWNAGGPPCVNLCNGAAAIHTADEHISVADLNAMVGVTLALIEAAHDGASP